MITIIGIRKLYRDDMKVITIHYTVDDSPIKNQDIITHKDNVISYNEIKSLIAESENHANTEVMCKGWVDITVINTKKDKTCRKQIRVNG